MEEIIRDVVTFTTVIFAGELVAYVIMEILVVIIRLATIKRSMNVDI